MTKKAMRMTIEQLVASGQKPQLGTPIEIVSPDGTPGYAVSPEAATLAMLIASAPESLNLVEILMSKVEEAPESARLALKELASIGFLEEAAAKYFDVEPPEFIRQAVEGFQQAKKSFNANILNEQDEGEEDEDDGEWS